MKEIAAWTVALIVAIALITLARYETRDPDSTLHVNIASRLAKEPLSRWIAPEWWNGWPGHSGLYREHPAGIFWLPALAARLGYPTRQAAYAVNTLYLVLTIVLIQRFAALFVIGMEARTLAWLLQLIPIAFTYRIRANHEQVVLLCVVAALYGIERSRTRAPWGLLTTSALVGLMAVKGIFAIFIPIACVLLLFSDRRGHGMRRAWIMVGVSVVVAIVCAGLYDYAYSAVTGESFIAPYLVKQLGVAAAPHGESIVLQKLANLVWYLARVAWFAFPWSLVLLALPWKRYRALAHGAEESRSTDQSRRAALACLALAGLYVLAFSLSDRKADRYVFPAYFLIAGCGAVMALRGSERLRRAAERLDVRQPWVTIGVFTATIALHLLGGLLHLPRVKFWPSD